MLIAVAPAVLSPINTAVGNGAVVKGEVGTSTSLRAPVWDCSFSELLLIDSLQSIPMRKSHGRLKKLLPQYQVDLLLSTPTPPFHSSTCSSVSRLSSVRDGVALVSLSKVATPSACSANLCQRRIHL